MILAVTCVAAFPCQWWDVAHTAAASQRARARNGASACRRMINRPLASTPSTRKKRTSQYRNCLH